MVARHPWLKLWAPHRLAWWIVVFLLSALPASRRTGHSFALPCWFTAVPSIPFSSPVRSLFATAATLQLEEAINGNVADIGASTGTHRTTRRWFAWKPRNVGYSAGLIQFFGTLLFNVNPGDVMLSQLTWLEEEVLIWTHDLIGSVCSLASGYLALVEVSHGFWSFQPRQLSWWIVMVNPSGCIAFMLAAGYGYFVPYSGTVEWSWGANFYTLLGAMCFFVAS